MTCSVCGADTPAGSAICSACDSIAGRNPYAGPATAAYIPRPRSTSTRNSELPPTVSTIWFIVLACASLASGYLLYGRSSPMNSFTIGEQVGHALGGLLLASLIAGLLHWLAKARFVLTLLIVWSILVPLTLFSVVQSDQQQRTAHLHQALEGLSQAINGKGPAPATSSATAANGASRDDSASTSPLQIAIERATQSTLAYKQQQALRLHAQRELHLELALQPQRLVSADGIEESREALAKYRILLAEHKAALKAYEDRNLSYLMDLPEPTKSGALAGFQKSRAITDDAFDRFFAVENRYVDTANQMLDVAQQALGRSSLDKQGKLRLPEPLHSQMRSLIQTQHEEAADEVAAQQNLRTLGSQYRTRFNNLIQQINAPPSSFQP